MADEDVAADGVRGAGPVLVPVDFSPASEAALVYAAELADCMEAPLHVLHIIHDPADAPGYYRLDGHDDQLLKLEDVAREMLERFMVRVRTAHPDRRALRDAQTELVAGLPVSRILEVVEQVEPRLVVMGSSGRTGLSHLLMGSKAEQTVRLCPVPVTIVKAPGRDPAEVVR